MTDNLFCWIAHHLVPQRLVFWCLIRAINFHAFTNPSVEVPAITGMAALQTWAMR
jgi:hypothetical protein